MPESVCNSEPFHRLFWNGCKATGVGVDVGEQISTTSTRRHEEDSRVTSAPFHIRGCTISSMPMSSSPTTVHSSPPAGAIRGASATVRRLHAALRGEDNARLTRSAEREATAYSPRGDTQQRVSRGPWVSRSTALPRPLALMSAGFMHCPWPALHYGRDGSVAVPLLSERSGILDGTPEPV